MCILLGTRRSLKAKERYNICWQKATKQRFLTLKNCMKVFFLLYSYFKLSKPIIRNIYFDWRREHVFSVKNISSIRCLNLSTVALPQTQHKAELKLTLAPHATADPYFSLRAAQQRAKVMSSAQASPQGRAKNPFCAEFFFIQDKIRKI